MSSYASGIECFRFAMTYFQTDTDVGPVTLFTIKEASGMCFLLQYMLMKFKRSLPLNLSWHLLLVCVQTCLFMYLCSGLLRHLVVGKHGYLTQISRAAMIHFRFTQNQIWHFSFDFSLTLFWFAIWISTFKNFHAVTT